jgi:hypothetical protein
MADNEATTAAEPVRPEPLDGVKKEYIAMLMKLLDIHAGNNIEVQKALAELKMSQKAPDSKLIDLIKVLCDCEAIKIILECLCKALT